MGRFCSGLAMVAVGLGFGLAATGCSSSTSPADKKEGEHMGAEKMPAEKMDNGMAGDKMAPKATSGRMGDDKMDEHK